MADGARVSRRWLYAVWIAAGVIVIAYYGLWRYAAGEMESAVHQWVRDQRAAGLVVEHGSLKRDGFPFLLRTHIAAPRIASPGAYEWTAERLTLDALPYDLNRLIFSPSGAQTFSAAEIGAWRYEAQDVRASIANDNARGWVFSMNVAGAEATRADGIKTQLQSLIYDLAPEAADPQTLTLSLAARGFSYQTPDGEASVDSLDTVLSLTQTGMLSLPKGLDAWRGAGGAFRIIGLNAVVNEAEVSVRGEIGVDALNRPEGALTAMLAKPVGLAPFLAASGALTPEEADAAAAGLGMAALAQGGRLEAPITIHAGEAMIAGVKIADLPPIE